MTWISLKRVLPVAGLAMLFSASSVTAQQPNQEEVFRLARQIQKKIVTLNNFGVFDYLTFGLEPGTAGYKVTLRGLASRPTLQKSAERVVARMELVESVVNEIEVLPNSRNDENIRLAAYAKIYGHPTLSRYNPNRGTPVYGVRRRASFGISNDPPIGPHPIHIIVNNGHITLEGVVDTEGDKAILNTQANSVSGAFSVTNNVEVLRASKKK